MKEEKDEPEKKEEVSIQFLLREFYEVLISSSLVISQVTFILDLKQN